MKTCSNSECTCINPQPHTNFSKDSRNKSGLQSQCKTCKYAINKAWANNNKQKIADYENSADRKARHKETTYAWRERNKDKYNAYMRQKNKARYPSARLARYGITLEDYNRMLEEQDNVCAICKSPAKGKRPLAVDHDHSSGKVRSLLCYGCNRALHVLETETLLVGALIYLQSYKAS